MATILIDYNFLPIWCRSCLHTSHCVKDCPARLSMRRAPPAAPRPALRISTGESFAPWRESRPGPPPMPSPAQNEDGFTLVSHRNRANLCHPQPASNWDVGPPTSPKMDQHRPNLPNRNLEGGSAQPQLQHLGETTPLTAEPCDPQTDEHDESIQVQETPQVGLIPIPTSSTLYFIPVLGSESKNQIEDTSTPAAMAWSPTKIS